MSKVIVLGHSKPYDFKQDNGDRLQGVKISYINSKPSVKDGEVGFTPIQVTVNPSVLGDLKELPGLYDVSFEMVAGRNNKPEIAVTGFDFIKAVDMQLLFS